MATAARWRGRTWRSTLATFLTVLLMLTALAVPLNWVAAMVVYAAAGGSGRLGRAADGRYFLNPEGREVEVDGALFRRLHAHETFRNETLPFVAMATLPLRSRSASSSG